MQQKDILIFGASMHAGVLIHAVNAEMKCRIVGVLDPTLPKGSSFHGVPVLGDDADVVTMVASGSPARGVVGIGDNFIRMRVMERITREVPGFEFITVIHPSAVVADGATIGAGAVVLAGAVIGPAATVEAGALVNSGAVLEHDCHLGRCASLGPGAVVCGNTRIGVATAVGPGATVIQNLTVGEHGVIGAGAVVVRDLPANALSWGVPARVIRKREPGEPYL